jgi:hypothetical protein
MDSCRTKLPARLARGLAAGLCAAWLAGAGPALAKDKDKASDREINEARDACKQIAENRDWKNVRTNVRDSSDERVVMTVSGKRRGEDRDRECRYNIKRHQAEFDDQG